VVSLARALCLVPLLLVTAWSMPLAADPPPQRGMFLLATPKVQHPMWRETVILLLEHGPGGTLGVVINRPLEIPPTEFMPELPGIRERELRLYFGGPVERRGLIWLLRTPTMPEAAREVLDGVGYGNDPALIAERLIGGGGDRELRLILGHAGWAPGQLAGEIERGDWRVVPADAASVFELESERQWRELLQRGSQRWVARPGPAFSPG
jgi:putative transcriptional regulator